MAEMRAIITTIQNENRELRKEVNRLKVTYEVPDGGGGQLTNSEKKAMRYTYTGPLPQFFA